MMGWTHGQNERLPERGKNRETRRLQKTKKTQTEVGGLHEERQRGDYKWMDKFSKTER